MVPAGCQRHTPSHHCVPMPEELGQGWHDLLIGSEVRTRPCSATLAWKEGREGGICRATATGTSSVDSEYKG